MSPVPKVTFANLMTVVMASKAVMSSSTSDEVISFTIHGPGDYKVTVGQSGKASDDNQYGTGGSVGEKKQNIGTDHAGLLTDLAGPRLLDTTNLGREIVRIDGGGFSRDF